LISGRDRRRVNEKFNFSYIHRHGCN
jgi:hypothetical protein